jgi:hypothetical protein
MTGMLILWGGITLFGVTMAFLQWLGDRRDERERRTAGRKHA